MPGFSTVHTVAQARSHVHQKCSVDIKRDSTKIEWQIGPSCYNQLAVPKIGQPAWVNSAMDWPEKILNATSQSEILEEIEKLNIFSKFLKAQISLFADIYLGLCHSCIKTSKSTNPDLIIALQILLGSLFLRPCLAFILIWHRSPCLPTGSDTGSIILFMLLFDYMKVWNCHIFTLIAFIASL